MRRIPIHNAKVSRVAPPVSSSVVYLFISRLGCTVTGVAIKPRGVPYHELAPEHMVITKLDGEIVEATFRPSSDLATHLEIYNNFPDAGGVPHTHSECATSWVQGQRPIPCLGTTHGDYFHGEIPGTNCLTPDEIAGDYEKNTGIVICRLLQNLDSKSVPAVLVAGHGPFCWGPTATAAAHKAVILESMARMAYYTVTLAGDVQPIASELHDKHFLRKHGHGAYHGQVKDK
jgi:L-ribulose-5-phosphate 4-epimerase